jgi:hypothetical protein
MINGELEIPHPFPLIYGECTNRLKGRNRPKLYKERKREGRESQIRKTRQEVPKK